MESIKNDTKWWKKEIWQGIMESSDWNKWIHIYIPTIRDGSGVHFDKISFIGLTNRVQGATFFTSASGKSENFKTLGIKLQ